MSYFVLCPYLLIVQKMTNRIPPLIDSEEKLKKNLVRQTILADIAQHFLSLDDFDEKISFTLSTIGHHTGVRLR